MKKLLVLFMVFTLIFSAAACGNPDTEGTAGDTQPAETTPTDPTENTDPTEAPTEATVPETEPHEHAYTSETTKAATCDKDGEITYTCECGDQKTESIKATGHSWSSWNTTVAPTFTSTGKSERTCSVCKKSESKKIDKNNVENELKRMAGYALDLPLFETIDDLSGGFIFDWAARAAEISSEWDEETFMVTKVYSVKKMNEHTERYLGTTFDYMYLLDYYDNMTYDADKDQFTLVVGAMGGWPDHFMDSYTKVDDTHYTLRYYGAYEENGVHEYEGVIGLKLTDKGFMIEYHKNLT